MYVTFMETDTHTLRPWAVQMHSERKDACHYRNTSCVVTKVVAHYLRCSALMFLLNTECYSVKVFDMFLLGDKPYSKWIVFLTGK